MTMRAGWMTISVKKLMHLAQCSKSKAICTHEILYDCMLLSLNCKQFSNFRIECMRSTSANLRNECKWLRAEHACTVNEIIRVWNEAVFYVLFEHWAHGKHKIWIYTCYTTSICAVEVWIDVYVCSLSLFLLFETNFVIIVYFFTFRN